MLMPKGKGKDTSGEAVKGIRTVIEVGEQNNAEIEILGGLSAGDQVIIPSPPVTENNNQQGRRR